MLLKNSEVIKQNFCHNYLTCYDNVREVDKWMSDLFCLNSTGGGSVTRSLYTNDTDFNTNFKGNLVFMNVSNHAA